MVAPSPLLIMWFKRMEKDPYLFHTKSPKPLKALSPTSPSSTYEWDTFAPSRWVISNLVTIICQWWKTLYFHVKIKNVQQSTAHWKQLKRVTQCARLLTSHAYLHIFIRTRGSEEQIFDSTLSNRNTNCRLLSQRIILYVLAGSISDHWRLTDAHLG